MIVRAGAEKGSLGDAYGAFDGDGGEAENEDFLADPDVVGNAEAPGKSDVHAAADDDAISNGGAKEPKPEDAQRRWPGKRALKEQAFHQDPKYFFDPGGSAIEPRCGVTG